jgi:membrane dipeptidase
MDDEQLLALKKNGGVIQVVGFASYIKAEPKQRTAAIMKLREEFGLASPGAGRGSGGGRRRAAAEGSSSACPVETPGAAPATRSRRGFASYGVDALSPERRAEYDKRLAEIDARYPTGPRANVKDFVNHIDYAVKLIGIDHVGISSDFDGGGGIDGWDSAAEAFNVTLELVRRGYTEEQIGKLWSGNLLRVWGEVEKVSQKLRKE